MARGSLVASLALHAGVITLVCSAALHERTADERKDAEATWVGDVDSAGELPAAEMGESGEVSSMAGNFDEFQPAKLRPPAVSASVVPALASAVPAMTANALPVPSLTTLPSFSKARAISPNSARAGMRSQSVKEGGRGGMRAGVPARYAFCPPPPFPPEARKARVSGTVLLTVKIDARGRPLSITVCRSSGHTMLDTAALRAVRMWRFEPAQRDGMPVDACLEIPVRFALS